MSTCPETEPLSLDHSGGGGAKATPISAIRLVSEENYPSRKPLTSSKPSCKMNMPILNTVQNARNKGGKWSMKNQNRGYKIHVFFFIHFKTESPLALTLMNSYQKNQKNTHTTKNCVHFKRFIELLSWHLEGERSSGITSQTWLFPPITWRPC